MHFRLEATLGSVLALGIREDDQIRHISGTAAKHKRVAQRKSAQLTATTYVFDIKGFSLEIT